MKYIIVVSFSHLDQIQYFIPFHNCKVGLFHRIYLSPGVCNKTNGGLVYSMLSHCRDLMRHLNRKELSVMVLVKAQLF